MITFLSVTKIGKNSVHIYLMVPFPKSMLTHFLGTLPVIRRRLCFIFDISRPEKLWDMVRPSTLPSATCMRPRPMSLTVIIFRPRVVTNFRSISKSRRVRPSPQSHSATHSFGFPSKLLRSGLWIKWQLYQYLYMVRERIMNSSKKSQGKAANRAISHCVFYQAKVRDYCSLWINKTQSRIPTFS